MLCVAIIIAPPDIIEKTTHFTWWGITSLAIFDISVVLKERNTTHVLYDSIYFLCATVACTIMIGVCVMSVSGCTMLWLAALDLGPIGYIIGNTLIHYYPVTRIMLHHPPPSTGRRPSQVVAACSLFITYLHCNPASSVYGCDFDESLVAVVSILGVITAFVCEAKLYQWYQHAYFKPTLRNK